MKTKKYFICIILFILTIFYILLSSCHQPIYISEKIKWFFLTDDYILSTPAIGSDGTIYLSSNDDNLYAINPDGTLKWSITTGNSIFSSAAIAEDGTIYFGSNDHLLYAVSSSSFGLANSAWPKIYKNNQNNSKQ